MSTSDTPLAGQPTPELARKGAGSNAQKAHRARQTEWARVWHSLPASSRNGFQRMAMQATPNGANKNRRANAFLFFANCCTALVQAGTEPVLTPASAPVYPPMLPKQMTLISAIIAGIFSLKIQSLGYDSPIAFYAAPVCMADSNVPASQYRYIGSATAIPAGEFDTASLYEAAYGTPQEGEKVALMLQGVSPTGSTTTKQMVAAITTVAAEASALADGEDSEASSSALKIA